MTPSSGWTHLSGHCTGLIYVKGAATPSQEVAVSDDTSYDGVRTMDIRYGICFLLNCSLVSAGSPRKHITTLYQDEHAYGTSQSEQGDTAAFISWFSPLYRLVDTHQNNFHGPAEGDEATT